MIREIRLRPDLATPHLELASQDEVDVVAHRDLPTAMQSASLNERTPKRDNAPPKRGVGLACASELVRPAPPPYRQRREAGGEEESGRRFRNDREAHQRDGGGALVERINRRHEGEILQDRVRCSDATRTHRDIRKRCGLSGLQNSSSSAFSHPSGS